MMLSLVTEWWKMVKNADIFSVHCFDSLNQFSCFSPIEAALHIKASKTEKTNQGVYETKLQYLLHPRTAKMVNMQTVSYCKNQHIPAACIRTIEGTAAEWVRAYRCLGLSRRCLLHAGFTGIQIQTKVLQQTPLSLYKHKWKALSNLSTYKMLFLNEYFSFLRDKSRTLVE